MEEAPVMSENQCNVRNSLSKLPDEILILILDKITTEDQWKTCILSKQWLKLWSTRVKLTLSCMELRMFPTCVSALEELYLVGVRLEADMVEKITTTMPSLALLSLSNCNQNSDLNIKISAQCRQLKLLINEEIGKVDRHTMLYLHASNIRLLEFASALPRVKYQVEDATFADEVQFSLEQMCNYRRAVNVNLGGLFGEQFGMSFLYLFDVFQRVGVLSLSGWCVQTLGLEIMMHAGRQLHYSSASHLKLEMGLRQVELIGIIYLLKSCQGMKMLSITTTNPEDFYFLDGLERAYRFRAEFCMENFIEDERYTDSVDLPELEVVEFKNYSANFEDELWGTENPRLYESRFLMETECGLTALSLLKAKAKNLRKLVFASRKGHCEIDLKDNRICYYPQLPWHPQME